MMQSSFIFFSLLLVKIHAIDCILLFAIFSIYFTTLYI